MLHDGSWAGHDVTIVGGGPSLRGFDWSALHYRRHVITINRAFKDAPTADLWFTEDARVITELWKERLRYFQGIKLWHCLNANEIPEVQAVDPSIEILQSKRKDKFWSASFQDGLGYSSNSGVGAINIAHILGADRIFLLGFDCRAEGLVMENYHKDYVGRPMWEVGSNAADNFKSDFEGWVAPHVKDIEVISVINPDYPTALKCWPTMEYAEFYRRD